MSGGATSSWPASEAAGAVSARRGRAHRAEIRQPRAKPRRDHDIACISRPPFTLARSICRVALQPEAGFDRHLVLRHLAVLDIAAHLNDLEPAEMAQRERGLGDGAVDRLAHAFVRRTDQFDDFIDVIRHVRSSRASFYGPRTLAPAARRRKLSAAPAGAWLAAPRA